MPAWGSLPETQRWQIVSFLRSLKNSAAENKSAAPPSKFTPTVTNAPLPDPPFTDFRVEQPGKTRKISPQDLPAPYVTGSSNNGPQLVPRDRKELWPKGAGRLHRPGSTPRDSTTRACSRTAPNGDIFVAESSTGKIKLFRRTSCGRCQARRDFRLRHGDSTTPMELPFAPARAATRIGSTSATQTP